MKTHLKTGWYMFVVLFFMSGCTYKMNHALVETETKPLSVLIYNDPDESKRNFILAMRDVLHKSFATVNIADQRRPLKTGEISVEIRNINYSTVKTNDHAMGYYYSSKVNASVGINTAVNDNLAYDLEGYVSDVNCGAGCWVLVIGTGLYPALIYSGLFTHTVDESKANEAAALDLQNKLVTSSEIKDYIGYSRYVEQK